MEQSLCTDDYISDIVSKYSNMVYKLALNRTNNRTYADDVFQDVFLRFIKNNRPFENEEHIKAWLIKVTVNCSKKHLTSAWFRRTVPLEGKATYEDKRETSVYSKVLKLPMKYRTVIHLHYYEDLSVFQISKALSIKESTIKSQLHRARHMLKTYLKGDIEYD